MNLKRYCQRIVTDKISDYAMKSAIDVTPTIRPQFKKSPSMQFLSKTPFLFILTIITYCQAAVFTSDEINPTEFDNTWSKSPDAKVFQMIKNNVMVFATPDKTQLNEVIHLLYSEKNQMIRNHHIRQADVEYPIIEGRLTESGKTRYAVVYLKRDVTRTIDTRFRLVQVDQPMPRSPRRIY